MAVLDGKKIIDRIRREEYLIGVDLTPEAARGATSLRRKLDKALRLLSEDLYSKETHFVLELIQNADDNNYPEREVPTIGFELRPEQIVVRNNETGFNEKNVRALCSVGETTKARHEGFIGEKGIGFKSVFTVSDRPEIHSNGFHFRFDITRHNELLGYVVPHWCGEEAHQHPPEVTTIVLPAKSGLKFNQEVLSELSEELLLFLRNIRRITLALEEGPLKWIFEREDKGALVSLMVRTEHLKGVNEERQRQFVQVRHKISMAEIAEEKRPDVSESEVVIAFPIKSDGKAQTNETHSVFAFLPVRDFGFRFLIQGDFLLSANREDIHRTRPWNLRIRDGIADAFIKNLEIFRANKRFALTFLSFVPRRVEIPDPFFHPVADLIVAKLSEESCILGISGTWRKPSDILLADEQFRALVPHPAALNIFGKDYASDDLDVANEVLRLLGCVPLSIQHIADLFEKAEWVTEQGSRWVAQFYLYLASTFTAAPAIWKLRKTKCLLLEDGRLVAPADAETFFPLERKKKYGFEKELKLIEDEIFEALPSSNEEIYRFLAKLGVRTPDPYSLIANHILPLHAKESWKESESAALIGHVRYIKDHLEDFISGCASRGQSRLEALARLRDGVWLRTKDKGDGKRWFSRASALYVSTEYEPSFGFEVLLGGHADPLQFISGEYLPPKLRRELGEEKASAIDDWYAFLRDIGVSEVPRVRSSTPYAGATEHECSKELETLLKSEDAKVRRQTIEAIDKNWGYYSGFSEATYPIRRATNNRKASHFLEALRATIAPTKKRKTVPLSTTYADIELVRSVFGDSTVYLDANVANPGFLDASGIIHRVDLSACLTRLDQLRAEERPKLGVVQRVYRQIEQLFERDPARARLAFHEAPRILVPSDTPRWVDAGQATWESHGVLLDNLFPPLAPHYREYHSLFCKRIGVPRELPISALVEGLRRFSEFEATEDEQRADALRIYRRVARELDRLQEDRGSEEPDWVESFRSQALFLDHMGRMVEATNELYVDDRPQISALFRDRERLSFLAVDWPKIPQIQSLIEIAGVPRLSERASFRVVSPELGTLDVETTCLIKDRYPVFVRVIYFASHLAFERATSDGSWQVLSELTIRKVPTLLVEVSLGGETATTESDVFRDGSTIYIRDGARGVIDKLSTEICLLVGVKPTLSDTISRVLLAKDWSELSEFLEVKGVLEVPAEELAKLIGASKTETGGDGERRLTREPQEQPEGDRGTRPEAVPIPPLSDETLTVSKEIPGLVRLHPRQEESRQSPTDPENRPGSTPEQPRKRVPERQPQQRDTRKQETPFPNWSDSPPDKRKERGQESEDWFADRLPNQLRAEWSVTPRGGGSSPFDFEISNGAQNVFIEVKTDSTTFFLTEREVEFARMCRHPYIVVLVGGDVSEGERQLRWLFSPLDDCVPWINGGSWSYSESVYSGHVDGWTVPEPRPGSDTPPRFHFRIAIPPVQELPTGWSALAQYLNGINRS